MDNVLNGDPLTVKDSTTLSITDSPTPNETPQPAPIIYTSVYPELLQIPKSTAPINKSYSSGAYQRITIDDKQLVGDIGVPGSDPTKPIYKQFRVSGDHIYVQKIDGTSRWGIRVGAETNPIIRLEEGMTIVREFNSLALATLDAPSSQMVANSERQVSRIELLISNGPLIISNGNKRYGFGAGSIGKINCIATPTPRLLFEDYDPALGFLSEITLGDCGALLYIRNSDDINTLYFRISQFSSFNTFVATTDVWRLYAGEPMVLPLDGRIVSFEDNSGLGVYCLSGTCKYDWWISRRSSQSPSKILSIPPY